MSRAGVDYAPSDMRVGLRCMAPLKPTTTARKRQYVDVEVVWVSRDGMVVEVDTFGTKKRPLRTTAHPSILRRPGTPTPPLGVVL